MLQRVEVKLFNEDLVRQMGCYTIIDNQFIFDYRTPGAAAFDICAIIPKPITVYHYAPPTRVPTGIGIQIDNAWGVEYNLLVLIRSGLSQRGLKLTNSAGLIDPDYQGEIICSLAHANPELPPYVIQPGERIAQAKFEQVCRFSQGTLVGEFSRQSARGEGAFGHTGRFA